MRSNNGTLAESFATANDVSPVGVKRSVDVENQNETEEKRSLSSAVKEDGVNENYDISNNNLHFSQNVPAAVAMNFAAQYLTTNDFTGCRDAQKGTEQREISGNDLILYEINRKSKKFGSVSNHSSEPSLHMNYFSFFSYYFGNNSLHFPSDDKSIAPKVEAHCQSCLSRDSFSEDLDDDSMINHQSCRLSPTDSSDSNSTSPPSSTSTSDSGFYNRNHSVTICRCHNHSGRFDDQLSFDQALCDRLSLLNLSPPLSPTEKDLHKTLLNGELCFSDDSLTAVGYSDENSSENSSDELFKSPNSQSMGSLFAKFIEYYSDPSIYDFVISVRTGSLMKRTDPIFARSSHTSMDTFICVEEPFNHTNTSHSVHNYFMFNFILKSFRWTSDLLKKMKMNPDDFV
ncbi:poly(A) RNA polymerase gld-2B-like protein [Sarcoptes scabiei]|uniref:Poly(A) RNA polymerase gld-2B-like protein n=1 Tax=Sarcoptes scabiei TaxID=52283 RepID=A0A132A2N7_SARSC|nr:poly(A) RNA polymerase gld-2B-like protein [Sarcoptes scabiei]